MDPHLLGVITVVAGWLMSSLEAESCSISESPLLLLYLGLGIILCLCRYHGSKEIPEHVLMLITLVSIPILLGMIGETACGQILFDVTLFSNIIWPITHPVLNVSSRTYLYILHSHPVAVYIKWLSDIHYDSQPRMVVQQPGDDLLINLYRELARNVHLFPGNIPPR